MTRVTQSGVWAYAGQPTKQVKILADDLSADYPVLSVNEADEVRCHAPDGRALGSDRDFDLVPLAPEG